MPYNNQFANKSSHKDIINNPEIKEFIEICDYITEPGEKEVGKIKNKFKEIENVAIGLDNSYIDKVMGIDGSNYETSIDDKLPSTKIGYVKISSLLIDLNKFNKIGNTNSRFVNPFKIAEIQKENESNTFVFPSANINYNKNKTVKDSFRQKLDDQLYNYRTSPNDPKTSLRTTLFHLASMRSGDLNTDNSNRLKLHKCPNPDCDEENVIVKDIDEPQYCNECKKRIYPSDVLRLWEEISENQSNQVAFTRFMQIVEHLIPVHYMRIISEASLESLSSVAFIIDGPLAIFGNAAWLHAAILKFVYDLRKKMVEKKLSPFILIGFQKTGQIVDYTNLVGSYIDKDSICVIDDDFRYEYIIPSRKPSTTVFGNETYYGQDFIYKTSTNRIFVFSLPFPVRNKTKSRDIKKFNEEKTKYKNYPELTEVIRLIKEFECDLYENSIIPIALAHRYTSISLKPGTKVLDLLTKKNLKNDKS